MPRLNRSRKPSIHGWTPAQLADLGHTLTQTLTPSVTPSGSDEYSNSTWTSERFAHLSATLSQGFHPGL